MVTNLESALKELEAIQAKMAEPNWRLAKEGVDALVERLKQEKRDLKELYGK